MTALGILWFVLIAVLMTGYFALDGFDLGAGVLYLYLGKSEEDKNTIQRAVGPVWDGNEVWLLTAGGALFAAFAPAYATSFSGFYLAIMLVLFGLIVRAVSLELRAHETNAKIRGAWDIAFFVSSLLPALLFGVAVGNVLVGLPLNANGDYTGGFFALLNPVSLLVGVLGLAHMMTQGAAWIACKAPEGSDLRDRACKMRRLCLRVDVVVFAVVSILYVAVIAPGTTYAIGNFALAVVFAIVYLAGVIVFARTCNDGKPATDVACVVASGVSCLGLVGILAATLFPNLIPATDSSLSLTIATCASSDTALMAMTIIACIGVPLVLVYHVIAYWNFRGRVK